LEAKVKRSVSICLLSVSLGMPAVIAETCHVDFKEVWAKKVAAIKAWNKSHASYVAQHHLDRDMSANTRRMKERARKALEVMCAIPNGGLLAGDSGNDLISSELHWMAQGPYVGASPFHDLGDDERVALGSGLIAAVDYPTYDSPSRALPETPGYGGFGGWYGSAGYIGGVPSAPPVTPIAPTPEPSTFALLAIGIAAGIWKVSRV
jgi:hypothetical protein